MSEDDRRRAPVQGDCASRLGPAKPRGTVAWWEHELAWQDYARRYSTRQSAEEIARRAGFGFHELTDHLGHEPTTWQPASRAERAARYRVYDALPSLSERARVDAADDGESECTADEDQQRD